MVASVKNRTRTRDIIIRMYYAVKNTKKTKERPENKTKKTKNQKKQELIWLAKKRNSLFICLEVSKCASS